MNMSMHPHTPIDLPPASSTLLQNQLLVTKFFIPRAPRTLISRPRLRALLDQSLEYPLTLVSAPAGFGKTTLLSTWAHSLPRSTSRLCWVSLDEEDNDPQLFWRGLLSALERQLPHHFAPLLLELQSQSHPPLKQLVIALINQLSESTEPFVLILDDYHLISQEQVHTTLAYLIQHLPPQLHIVIATRADPPLLLPIQRARHHILEVRTEELRCTVGETKAFFDQVMEIHLPDETIQEVTARTEGWLVGLQLLGLSLPEHADPTTLLQEISGKQRYIQDYLTEVVLRRQPQEVQRFLLCTCMLERLTASLCDAVMEQSGSQQMLKQLEQSNLFVVSLDSKRQWYRYHALFAQALYDQLEQTHADLVSRLHHRASLWYAQHDQITEAVLHALKAHEWQWAADLIEQKSLQVVAISWGGSGHQLLQLREWLEQLPIEVMASRPRFCINCVHLLWQVTQPTMLEAWSKAAEATLTASLTTQMQEDVSQPILDPKARQELQDLLGNTIRSRAFFQSFEESGEASLALCQQALALISADNFTFRAHASYAQSIAYHASSANSAEASIESGLQAASLARMAGQVTMTIGIMGTTAARMIGTGQLHQIQELTQQAILLGTKPGGEVLPEVSWLTIFQAEILREWNHLDTARSLAEEAILLCEQVKTNVPLSFLFFGYEVLLRVSLSCGELNTAGIVFQQIKGIRIIMNQSYYAYLYSLFATVDQVRFWLACGELDRATRWAEELDVRERHGTPFAHEREEVACVRVLLAKHQPTLALQRLEPVLQRATTGKRWGHVIEIRLLQALAYQMGQKEAQALDALSEAVRLAEPEGYIRSFVDEGAPMEALLYRLRKRDLKSGPTAYLDRLLAAFHQESRVCAQAEERTRPQDLSEPLSERELQVLHLLAQGVSNQEIAQELVIAYDTVKRHVRHIFGKLGVTNRILAVRQARDLGLLDEES